MTLATQANQFQDVQESRSFAPTSASAQAFRLLWKSSYPYVCIAWIAVLLLGSMIFVHLHQMTVRSQPTGFKSNKPSKGLESSIK